MPRKKKPGSRGESPEKIMQSGPVGNQYGSESSSWIGVKQSGSGHVQNSGQEQTFHHLQEMFKGSVDGEVVYMVLSECDWKVDETIEKLLQMVPQDGGSKQPVLSMKSVADSLKYNIMNPGGVQGRQITTVHSQSMSAGYSNSVVSPQAAQPSQMSSSGHSTNAEPMPQQRNSNPHSRNPLTNMQRQDGQSSQTGNIQINLRSRLPSVKQQEGSDIDLPMLSPRTPSINQIDFPSFGQDSPREANVQSALEAFDSYANRTTNYPSSFNRTNSYGNIGNDGMFDLHGMNDFKGTLYVSNEGNKLSNSSQPHQNQLGQGLQGQSLQDMFEQQQMQQQFSQMYGLNDMQLQAESGFNRQGDVQQFTGSNTGHSLLDEQYQNRLDQNLNITSPFSQEAATVDHSYATQDKSQRLNMTSISQPPPLQQSPNSMSIYRSGSNYGQGSFSFPQQQQNAIPNQQYSDVQQGEPPLLAKPPVAPRSGNGKTLNDQQAQTAAEARREKSTILRKQAISLDPQERESLEKLIEEVIIDGVGEDIMDDESTSSDDDDSPAQTTDENPAQESESRDKDSQKSPGSNEKNDMPPTKGKKGKKNGKDENTGKAHPSHLKVAAKHMKNLPPRFLRRLQVAQKQGEIKVDGTIEGLVELGLVPPEVLEEEKKERQEKEKQEKEQEKQKEKEKGKKKTEQPKKPKKKRNLLESLTPYFDDAMKDNTPTEPPSQQNPDTNQSEQSFHAGHSYVLSDHSNSLNTPDISGLLDVSPQSGPPSRTSPKANMKPLPMMMNSPNIVLRQTAMNCEDLERELLKHGGHGREELGTYTEPPRPQRLAASGGTIDRPSGYGGESSDSLDRWSQFSVDAPEFVPRTFTPINPLGMDMPCDQPTQPRLTTSQPFIKSGSPFQALQAPIGRMSPQLVPPQVAAAQLATQGRHSPSPTFLIPKANPTPVNTAAALQAHPSIGVMAYPYPVATYPYPGPGYQLQYRAPFMPPGGGGYPTSWSPDSKGQDAKGVRGTIGPQSYTFSPKTSQQHIGWSQNVHGPPIRSSPISNTRMNSPNLRRRDQRYAESNVVKPQDSILRSERIGNGDGHFGNKSPGEESALSSKEKIASLVMEGKKVLVLLRGPPGSGKSTLARELQFDGVTLTTDQYFMRGENYEFDASKLGEAHEWNQKRAKEAMQAGKSPIIIDNTNTQDWEMKPYAVLAFKNDYQIEIVEPKTPWKFKPRELVKRNTHGVTLESIQHMLERYDHKVTVESLLGRSAIHTIGADTRYQQLTRIPEIMQQQPRKSLHQPVVPQPLDLEVQQPPKKHKKRRRKRKRGRKNHAAGEEKHDEDKDASSEDESTPDRDIDSSMEISDLSAGASFAEAIQAVSEVSSNSMNTENCSLQTVPELSDVDNYEKSTHSALLSTSTEPSPQTLFSSDANREMENVSSPTSEYACDSMKQKVDPQKLEDENLNIEKHLLEKSEKAAKSASILNNDDAPENVQIMDQVFNNTGQAETPQEISASPTNGNDASSSSTEEQEKMDQSKEEETDNEEKEIIDEEKDGAMEKMSCVTSEGDCSTDESLTSLPENIEGLFQEMTDKTDYGNGIECKSVGKKIRDCNIDKPKTYSCDAELSQSGEPSPTGTCDTVLNNMTRNLNQSACHHEHSNEIAITNEREGHIDVECHTAEENLVLQPGQIVETIEKTLRQIKKKNKDAGREVIIKALDEELEQSQMPEQIRDEIREIIHEKVAEGAVNQEVANITSKASTLGKSNNVQTVADDPKVVNDRVSHINGIDTDLLKLTVAYDPDQHLIENDDSGILSGKGRVDMDKEYEEYMKHLQEGSIEDEGERVNIEEKYWSQLHNDCDVYKIVSTSLQSQSSWSETIADGWNFPKPKRDTTPESWNIPQSPDVKTDTQESAQTTEDSMSTLKECIRISPVSKYTTDYPVRQPDSPVSSKSDASSTPGDSSTPVLEPCSAHANKPQTTHLPVPATTPQLDPEMKKQLLGFNWLLPSFESANLTQAECILTETVDKKEVAVFTDPKDFSAIHTLSQGFNLEEYHSFVKVLKTNPREISDKADSMNNKPKASPSRSLLMTLEKGCSTTDLTETTANDDGIEFLKNCFPDVKEDDLSDILCNCKGDIQWAVNLLLDSGFEYNQPLDTETNCLPEGEISPKADTNPPVVKPKECISKPQVTATSPRSMSVLPLALLCQEVLSPTTALASDDIQETISQGSFKRLKTIEEFQSKRKVSTSESVPELNYMADLSTFSFENSFAASFIGKSDTDFNKVPSLDLAVGTSNAHVGNELDGFVDGKGEASDVTSQQEMTLTLSMALARQLINVFGPVGFHISPDSLSPSDMNVVLNRQTARQIHRRWALTLQQKFDSEELAIKRMISQDEELARKLQAEEDREHQHSLSMSNPDPAVTAQNKRPVLPEVCMIRRSPPPSSLKEIMDEQMVIEISRKEFMQQACQKETTIATKMKQQKLLEMFPDIDAPTLQEIFQANSFDLGTTISAIHTSLGVKETPQNIMSPEAISAYEEKLVKQATKESLKQQWLGVADEEVEVDNYQTLADPNYRDFRAEASLHYRLRHECFQKAQEAYHRNMKAVASFYSQQGHLHTEKLKEANKRAGEKILEIRNEALTSTNTIDLHGLHVDEAISALETVLTQRESELCSHPDKRKSHLFVVTGRGNHSRGGVAKIKPAVIDCLHRNNYNFVEQHPGLLKVTMKYREMSH